MTIKDLARISGYSLGTVSRVLNNQPNVSQKARDAIMAIVEEAGFELNSNAKNLKQQKGSSVLVIVKGRANELFSQLVEQIQSQMAETEFPLLVDYIDEDENEVRRALQLCREKKPLGILFLGGTSENFLEDFGKVRLPAVLVTNSAENLPFPNLSSVTTDDAAAAECAVCHLLEQGHREIVILGGDTAVSEISRLRYEGCVRALQGRAEMCDYETTRFSFLDGYQSMGRVLELCGSSVTAVFAMADVIAIGAIRCICDHGLRVPEDISVIGFDGLSIGQYYTPKLATIRQQTDDMARECVRILLGAMEGEAARHRTVPYTRLAGESIRKLG